MRAFLIDTIVCPHVHCILHSICLIIRWFLCPKFFSLLCNLIFLVMEVWTIECKHSWCSISESCSQEESTPGPISPLLHPAACNGESADSVCITLDFSKKEWMNCFNSVDSSKCMFKGGKKRLDSLIESLIASRPRVYDLKIVSHKLE